MFGNQRIISAGAGSDQSYLQQLTNAIDDEQQLVIDPFIGPQLSRIKSEAYGGFPLIDGPLVRETPFGHIPRHFIQCNEFALKPKVTNRGPFLSTQEEDKPDMAETFKMSTNSALDKARAVDQHGSRLTGVQLQAHLIKVKEAQDKKQQLLSDMAELRRNAKDIPRHDEAARDSARDRINQMLHQIHELDRTLNEDTPHAGLPGDYGNHYGSQMERREEQAAISREIARLKALRDDQVKAAATIKKIDTYIRGFEAAIDKGKATSRVMEQLAHARVRREQLLHTYGVNSIIELEGQIQANAVRIDQLHGQLRGNLDNAVERERDYVVRNREPVEGIREGPAPPATGEGSGSHLLAVPSNIPGQSLVETQRPQRFDEPGYVQSIHTDPTRQENVPANEVSEYGYDPSSITTLRTFFGRHASQVPGGDLFRTKINTKAIMERVAAIARETPHAMFAVFLHQFMSQPDNQQGRDRRNMVSTDIREVAAELNNDGLRSAIDAFASVTGAGVLNAPQPPHTVFSREGVVGLLYNTQAAVEAGGRQLAGHLHFLRNYLMNARLGLTRLELVDDYGDIQDGLRGISRAFASIGPSINGAIYFAYLCSINVDFRNIGLNVAIGTLQRAERSYTQQDYLNRTYDALAAIQTVCNSQGVYNDPIHMETSDMKVQVDPMTLLGLQAVFAIISANSNESVADPRAAFSVLDQAVVRTVFGSRAQGSVLQLSQENPSFTVNELSDQAASLMGRLHSVQRSVPATDGSRSDGTMWPLLSAPLETTDDIRQQINSARQLQQVAQAVSQAAQPVQQVAQPVQQVAQPVQDMEASYAEEDEQKGYAPGQGDVDMGGVSQVSPPIEKPVPPKKNKPMPPSDSVGSTYQISAGELPPAPVAPPVGGALPPIPPNPNPQQRLRPVEPEPEPAPTDQDETEKEVLGLFDELKLRILARGGAYDEQDIEDMIAGNRTPPAGEEDVIAMIREGRKALKKVVTKTTENRALEQAQERAKSRRTEAAKARKALLAAEVREMSEKRKAVARKRARPGNEDEFEEGIRRNDPKIMKQLTADEYLEVDRERREYADGLVVLPLLDRLAALYDKPPGYNQVVSETQRTYETSQVNAASRDLEIMMQNNWVTPAAISKMVKRLEGRVQSLANVETEALLAFRARLFSAVATLGVLIRQDPGDGSVPGYQSPPAEEPPAEEPPAEGDGQDYQYPL